MQCNSIFHLSHYPVGRLTLLADVSTTQNKCDGHYNNNRCTNAGKFIVRDESGYPFIVCNQCKKKFMSN